MDGLQNLIDAVEDKIYELEGDDAYVTSSSKISSATKSNLEKVMNDPDYELGDADENGEQEVYCCGKYIGTINAQKGTCDIDDKKDSKKKIKSFSSIKAAGSIETKSDLEVAIREALDSDICEAIVNEAFSDTSMFEKDVFIDSGTFFDTELIDTSAKNIALKFYNGKDIDDGGSANPNKQYFRFNKKKNIESTDYPGDIYFDTLEDDIIQYILDNIEETKFPDYIQELIDEYIENTEA